MQKKHSQTPLISIYVIQPSIIGFGGWGGVGGGIGGEGGTGGGGNGIGIGPIRSHESLLTAGI